MITNADELVLFQILEHGLRDRTVSHCSKLACFVKLGLQQLQQLRQKARCTHLSVIDLARAEQRSERIIAGNHEAGNVDEELAGDVEKDEEEVEGSEP